MTGLESTHWLCTKKRGEGVKCNLKKKRGDCANEYDIKLPRHLRDVATRTPTLNIDCSAISTLCYHRNTCTQATGSNVLTNVVCLVIADGLRWPNLTPSTRFYMKHVVSTRDAPVQITNCAQSRLKPYRIKTALSSNVHLKKKSQSGAATWKV